MGIHFANGSMAIEKFPFLAVNKNSEVNK